MDGDSSALGASEDKPMENGIPRRSPSFYGGRWSVSCIRGLLIIYPDRPYTKDPPKYRDTAWAVAVGHLLEHNQIFTVLSQGKGMSL